MSERRQTPSRSTILARRLLAAGLALAVVIVVVLVSGGSSATSPPATAAARLVPADALAYVNVSLDRGRPAVRQALKVAARLPDFDLGAALIEQRLAAIAAPGIDYATQVRPWLGDEAALAILDTPTSTAGSLLLLGVADHARAAAFLRTSGAVSDGHDRGVALLRYRAGGVAAFIGGFVALGQAASVRAAIDVSAGVAPSLAANPTYRRAAAGEPPDRVIDAYASADGVQRLLAPQSGLAGALGDLLYQPAELGVTASVSATVTGLQVRIHTALDPSLVSVSGHRDPSFTPTLPRVVPSGAIVMLDVSGLARVAPEVLAATAAAGIGSGIAPLLSRLGTALRSEGVNLAQILQLFGGETAVTVTGGAKPALLIVARIASAATVRTELASLAIPLQQLFQSSGQGNQSAPLGQRQIDGVTVHLVPLRPGLELDYAVNDGLLAVSTGTQAMAALLGRSRAVAQDAGYRAALAEHPGRVTSLTYLAFSQLLGLGDQTGLTRSAKFKALRQDLQKIHAVGLSSTSGKTDSTAELFLQIS